MQRTTLIIGRSWEGAALDAEESVTLELGLGERELIVDVSAPFHGDPAPPGPPGSVDGLWEYEVVELFLLGDAERYLEVEIGPLGHYLALQLRGPRHVEASGLVLDVGCEPVEPFEAQGPRWRGRARLPVAYLPDGLRAANAYAMHGLGDARRYLAAHPVPGAEPDFHRLEHFRPLVWQPRRGS